MMCLRRLRRLQRLRRRPRRSFLLLVASSTLGTCCFFGGGSAPLGDTCRGSVARGPGGLSSSARLAMQIDNAAELDGGARRSVMSAVLVSVAVLGMASRQAHAEESQRTGSQVGAVATEVADSRNAFISSLFGDVKVWRLIDRGRGAPVSEPAAGGAPAAARRVLYFSRREAEIAQGRVRSSLQIPAELEQAYLSEILDEKDQFGERSVLQPAALELQNARRRTQFSAARSQFESLGDVPPGLSSPSVAVPLFVSPFLQVQQASGADENRVPAFLQEGDLITALSSAGLSLDEDVRVMTVQQVLDVAESTASNPLDKALVKKLLAVGRYRDIKQPSRRRFPN